ADFAPSEVQFVCAGGSLTFTDASYNGQPTSYSWNFQGGTPNTSTDSVETVQYNTPGTYSVSLTASNAQGSDGVNRTNYVVVLPATAQYNNTIYSEGFENTTTFANDWDIVSPQVNAWALSTSAAFTGTHSIRLDNTTAMVGTVDDFISPTIDLSVMNAPSMTFKVAFAQRTSSDNDRLKVFVSLDCGRTWSQRFSKSGPQLSTVAAQSGAFTPNSGQWRTETVTFNSAQQVGANVRVKFEFTSDGGNDIWIDDINIQGATGIMSPAEGINAFDVYPNPAQDNTMIEFSLEERDHINVEIVDLNGKIVQSVYNGDLASGIHRFPVQTAELSSGIYLVRLVTDDGKYLTRRLVIE
ncbi:MAG TPA: T9SS type A sorting domain-containing protein, partial [Bacteroidia bacterium]|nr:T9SS type A sorting domain-containing protein [Bacteroidia bacterium]